MVFQVFQARLSSQNRIWTPVQISSNHNLPPLVLIFIDLTQEAARPLVSYGSSMKTKPATINKAADIQIGESVSTPT